MNDHPPIGEVVVNTIAHLGNRVVIDAGLTDRLYVRFWARWTPAQHAARATTLGDIPMPFDVVFVVDNHRIAKPKAWGGPTVFYREAGVRDAVTTMLPVASLLEAELIERRAQAYRTHRFLEGVEDIQPRPSREVLLADKVAQLEKVVARLEAEKAASTATFTMSTSQATQEASSVGGSGSSDVGFVRGRIAASSGGGTGRGRPTIMVGGAGGSGAGGGGRTRTSDFPHVRFATMEELDQHMLPYIAELQAQLASFPEAGRDRRMWAVRERWNAEKPEESPYYPAFGLHRERRDDPFTIELEWGSPDAATGEPPYVTEWRWYVGHLLHTQAGEGRIAVARDADGNVSVPTAAGVALDILNEDSARRQGSASLPFPADTPVTLGNRSLTFDNLISRVRSQIGANERLSVNGVTHTIHEWLAGLRDQNTVTVRGIVHDSIMMDVTPDPSVDHISMESVRDMALDFDTLEASLPISAEIREAFQNGVSGPLVAFDPNGNPVASDPTPVITGDMLAELGRLSREDRERRSLRASFADTAQTMSENAVVNPLSDNGGPQSNRGTSNTDTHRSNRESTVEAGESNPLSRRALDHDDPMTPPRGEFVWFPVSPMPTNTSTQPLTQSPTEAGERGPQEIASQIAAFQAPILMSWDDPNEPPSGVDAFRLQPDGSVTIRGVRLADAPVSTPGFGEFMDEREDAMMYDYLRVDGTIGRLPTDTVHTQMHDGIILVRNPPQFFDVVADPRPLYSLEGRFVGTNRRASQPLTSALDLLTEYELLPGFPRIPASVVAGLRVDMLTGGGDVMSTNLNADGHVVYPQGAGQDDFPQHRRRIPDRMPGLEEYVLHPMGVVRREGAPAYTAEFLQRVYRIAFAARDPGVPAERGLASRITASLRDRFRDTNN